MKLDPWSFRYVFVWLEYSSDADGSAKHAFENLEAEAKDGIVDELIGHGAAVFGDVAKNQWGSYCVQHSESLFDPCLPHFASIAPSVLEHGSERHRDMTLQHLLDGLLEFATHEQGAKSVTKALKEGGKPTLDKIVERMCEPAKGYVCPIRLPKRCHRYNTILKVAEGHDS